MKKLGLITLLSVLTVGALVGCGNPGSSSEPTSSSEPQSSEVSSEEVSSESSSEKVETNELPAAWGEGATYSAYECNVSFIPGAIAKSKEEPTVVNSHAKPLKDYLHLEGARYFDLRDASEGYGVGHVQGFESVSYFKTIVGTDNQLFYTDADGKYVARYEESVSVLNKIFPKDATLFVMCQVGGRVQPFLKLLAQYEYDMSKVYNVGGWNQLVAKTVENYGGYKVSLGIGASEITYNFGDLTPVEEEVAAAKAQRRSAQLPAAWGEGATYSAYECNVSFIPGAIAKSKEEPTVVNSHAKPLKDYLHLEGARYFDLRDASEGYGVGHVQGFESVSYFKTIVGTDNQLFYTDADGKYVARYEESVSVLNKIFPKDATLFVMCQVGGRVQPFLKLLAQYEYDMSKVYNVGGWNQLVAKTVENYGGYKVSLGIGASAITYNFGDLTPVEA